MLAEIESTAHRALRSLMVVFPVLLLTLMFWTAGVMHALAAEREITIGFFNYPKDRIEDKESFVIAEIINGTLPHLIEKKLAEFEYFSWVEQLGDLQLEGDPASLETIEPGRYVKQGVDLLLIPSIDQLDAGRQVTLRILDLRRSDLSSGNAQSVKDSVLIRPGADFAEIEENLLRLAERSAKRIASGRTVQTAAISPTSVPNTILFRCIQPEDPTNRFLASVSRRLTLELPFFVSEAVKEADLLAQVDGLSPWMYDQECLDFIGKQATSTASRGRLAQYDLVIHGWFSEAQRTSGDYQLDLSISSRGETVLQPLHSTTLDPKSVYDKDALRRMSSEVVEALAKSGPFSE